MIPKIFYDIPRNSVRTLPFTLRTNHSLTRRISISTRKRNYMLQSKKCNRANPETERARIIVVTTKPILIDQIPIIRRAGVLLKIGPSLRGLILHPFLIVLVVGRGRSKRMAKPSGRTLCVLINRSHHWQQTTTLPSQLRSHALLRSCPHSRQNKLKKVVWSRHPTK